MARPQVYHKNHKNHKNLTSIHLRTPGSKMQRDFRFHFSSSGNGLARLAIASPMSLGLPILRPLLLSPPASLSEMGASRGARTFPRLSRPQRAPGLKTERRIVKLKNKKKLDENNVLAKEN